MRIFLFEICCRVLANIKGLKNFLRNTVLYSHTTVVFKFFKFTLINLFGIIER